MPVRNAGRNAICAAFEGIPPPAARQSDTRLAPRPPLWPEILAHDSGSAWPASLYSFSFR
jgi:hypothetical protein